MIITIKYKDEVIETTLWELIRGLKKATTIKLSWRWSKK